MMFDDSIMINFHDHAENQAGFVMVRKYDDRVAICLSLETNGDVEALVEKDVVQKLIVALQESILQGGDDEGDITDIDG